MFLSLGSIIGSGWLLGALTTAVIAGPASLISWVLASTMLAVLALAHAELGATYPIAGGTAQFPFFAFGPLTGFTAGWMSWLRSALISPSRSRPRSPTWTASAGSTTGCSCCTPTAPSPPRAC